MSDRIADYGRDGYLLVRDALDPTALAMVRTELEAHVEGLALHLLENGRINDLYADAPFEQRLARIAADAGLDLRKWMADLRSEGFHRLVTSPGLVDALVEVLGPEVVFHGDMQVTPKLPGSDRAAFGWHQDTAYYGEAARHLHVVTVWAPLVPATEENGCLWVIPGSHRWGLLPTRRPADGGNVVTLVDVDGRADAVPLALDPGDAVLLSNLTCHASFVNRSAGVRWTTDLAFSAIPSAGDGPEVDASRRYLWSMLASFGRVPMLVAGTDGAERWPVWRDRSPAADIMLVD